MPNLGIVILGIVILGSLSYTTEKTVPIVLEVLLREFLISKWPLVVESLEPLFFCTRPIKWAEIIS